VCALREATGCQAEQDDRFKVFGADRDGDDLTMVVVLEAGVLVVTLF
jgi:hypothetical protein